MAVVTNATNDRYTWKTNKMIMDDYCKKTNYESTVLMDPLFIM